jgi:hypothetical protein
MMKQKLFKNVRCGFLHARVYLVIKSLVYFDIAHFFQV